MHQLTDAQLDALKVYTGYWYPDQAAAFLEDQVENPDTDHGTYTGGGSGKKDNVSENACEGTDDYDPGRDWPNEIRFRILLYATVLAPTSLLAHHPWDPSTSLPLYAHPDTLDADQNRHHSSCSTLPPSQLKRRPLVTFNRRLASELWFSSVICFAPTAAAYANDAYGILCHNIISWCSSSLATQMDVLERGHGSGDDSGEDDDDDYRDEDGHVLPATLQHPLVKHPPPRPQDDCGSNGHEYCTARTSAAYRALPFVNRLDHLHTRTCGPTSMGSPTST